MKKLVFMGHGFSEEGIETEETKIQVVVDAKRAESASEVRSFLGLVNFCGRFIPNLAAISEPLRKLTRKSNQWTWGKDQENSSVRLKSEPASAHVIWHISVHPPRLGLL